MIRFTGSAYDINTIWTMTGFFNISPRISIAKEPKRKNMKNGNSMKKSISICNIP